MTKTSKAGCGIAASLMMTAAASAQVEVEVSIIGGVEMGGLVQHLFVFTDGSHDANWQGATKGFAGDVAVRGLLARERTSGGVPFGGTIYSDDSTLNDWQDIVDQNPGQAAAATGEGARLDQLSADLQHAVAQIEALPATPGFESRTPESLDGLNTQNRIAEVFVINVTSDLKVSSQITITGDATDAFFLRWDEDANPANGYQGQVKFQSGGAIIPGGALTPGNFVHLAGDINASGGGSTPPAPFPQGPRDDDGQGGLISGGNDFSGGGFFTGFWLTTGDPSDGDTSSLSNGIFVGGWFTSSDKFSLTSGTSGVFVQPNPALCPGDFNADGVVNSLDWMAFLNAWNAEDPAADFNKDGVWNILDLLVWGNRFEDAWYGRC